MNRAALVALVLCSACQDVPGAPAERIQSTQAAFLDGCTLDLECGDVDFNPCDGTPRCVNGECIVEMPNCDDGLFCNGEERCIDVIGCFPGTPPCVGGCEEATDICSCGNPDADGDTHNAIGCGGDDCDDFDPHKYPGNFEICDTAYRDEDCDPLTVGDRDSDGDGYIDARCCNGFGATAVCGDDCNDFAGGVHPHVPDLCDGIDNDCDGTPDDDGLDTDLLCVDADHDGYGAGAPVRVCRGSVGYSYLCNDCDDTSASFYPGIQVCTGTETVKYCGADGQSHQASCDSTGARGAFCFPQPNGTGACISPARPR